MKASDARYEAAIHGSELSLMILVWCYMLTAGDEARRDGFVGRERGKVGGDRNPRKFQKCVMICRIQVN
jgi:hypothetical protein